MRLLIVDDEPSILELLGVALKALGTYKVKTATSAKHALQLLEGRPKEFDAFLLDIQMPEMNGIDLCARIRGMEVYRNAPILMLTAMSQMSYVEKAFEAGATDYVTKPFNFEDLKQRLNTARKQKYSKTAGAEGEDSSSMMRSVLYNGSHDYSEELDFSKMARFIGKAEFENYVRQMSLSKASQTRAFALRVANGADIAQGVSSMEFLKTFQQVADAMVQGTERSGSLLSYFGEGLFLCAEHGSRLTDTEKLERTIVAAMASGTFPGPTPAIAVGAHAMLDTFDSASGQKLLTEAIEKARARDPFVIRRPAIRGSEDARPMPRTQPAPTRRPPVSDTQAAPAKPRPDRRAYEKLLLDSLRNG